MNWLMKLLDSDAWLKNVCKDEWGNICPPDTWTGIWVDGNPMLRNVGDGVQASYDGGKTWEYYRGLGPYQQSTTLERYSEMDTL